MTPPTRHYLLIVFSPVVVLVVGNVLLNLWVDPMDLYRDHRLATRNYSLPRIMTELGRPTPSEVLCDTLLVGTSRTDIGIDVPDGGTELNLGISGADDRMIEHLLHNLLGSSEQPRTYWVETTGSPAGRHHVNYESWFSQLFSGGTTKLSLRHLADEAMRWSKGQETVAPAWLSSDTGSQDSPKRIHEINTHLRDLLAVSPTTRDEIEQRVQALATLPVEQPAVVVFYDPPYSSANLTDPAIREALATRAELWQQAVALTSSAAKVQVRFVSLATPADWSSEDATVIWAERHWFDSLHFKPQVGERVLARLREFSENRRQMVR